MIVLRLFHLLLLCLITAHSVSPASQFQKFRIFINTNQLNYEDAAMYCQHRNSSLVESSTSMKEKLQLLIVSQNPDELGPLNVSIWLKENEMSSGQKIDTCSVLDPTNTILHEDEGADPEQDSCSCDDIARLPQNTCERFKIPQPQAPTALPPPVMCKAKTINGFTFPTTHLYSNANSDETCFTHNATATISCAVNGSRSALFNESSLWTVSCSAALDDVKAKINNDLNLNQVVSELQVITSRNSSSASNNVVKIAETLNQIGEVAMQNDIEIPPSTFQNVLSIASTVSEKSSNLSAAEQSGFVQTVETISTRIVLSEEASVVNIRAKAIEAQVNLVNFTSAEEIITLPKINEADLDTLSSANIELPAKDLCEQFSRESVTVIVYKDDSLLPNANGSSHPIVGVLVGNRSHVSLNKDIKIQFKKHNSTFGRPKIERTSQGPIVKTVKFVDKRCAYWNFTLSSWKFDGCFLDTSSDVATCKCNHLTNFAVLINIYDVPSDVELNTATTVACAVALLALFITIAYHLSEEKLRQTIPAKIQVNIFINLFIAYLFFVVGIGRVNTYVVCNVITGVLHFTFLASFFWMSVFCHSIYTTTKNVFSSPSPKYIWKAAAFAYGIPALVVAGNILLVVFYLDTSVTHDFPVDVVRPKSKYFHDTACWVSVESLYYSFLLIVGLNLLYNLVVVILVSKNAIFKEQKDLRSTREKKSKVRKILLVFSMSSTVGLNWILGFFLLITPDPIFQKVVAWIFTVVTALQGIFILYFTCIKRILASSRARSRSASQQYNTASRGSSAKETHVSSSLASKGETFSSNRKL